MTPQQIWAQRLKRYRSEKANEYARAILLPPKKAPLYSTLRYPGVAVIMGDIRTGKTALAHDVAGLFHNKRNLPAVLHLPTIDQAGQRRIQKLLPPWMRVVGNFSQWPQGSVVIYDEAAHSAHSRRSQSEQAIELDELLALSGQKQHLILFISHYSRKLDLNVCTSVHRLIWKRPTYAHQLWERDEMADFTSRAYDFFHELKGEAARKRTSLVLNMDDFAFYQCTNGLPAWWSDDLSRLFKENGSRRHKKGGKAQNETRGSVAGSRSRD